MGLIPQVKCSRCDRKYSGLLAKCPYCGARRRKKSTRAVTNENSTWKMVVGLLLLIVLIAAVVVLLVTSISENKKNEENNKENNQQDVNISSNEGVTSSGDDATVDPDSISPENQGVPVDTEPDIPDEPVTPTVNSVTITYGGSAVGVNNEQLGMREFTIKSGESLKLGVKVSPEDTGLEPVWASEDESKIIVLQTGEITAVASSSTTTTISVTVGDVTETVFVRIRG